MTNSGAIVFFLVFAIFYVFSCRYFSLGNRMGRLRFAASLVVINVSVVGVSLLMSQIITTAQNPDPGLFFGISFLTTAAAGTAVGYVVASRMSDIGLSFYWSILGLVTPVNVALLIPLLALPSNFRSWQTKLKAAADLSESPPDRLREYEQEFVLKHFLEAESKDAEVVARGIYGTFGHGNTKRVFRMLFRRAMENKKYKADGGGEQAILRSLLETISAQESDGTEIGKLLTRSEILKRLVGTQSLENEAFDADNGINWLIELAEDRIGLSANGAKFAILGLLMTIYEAVSEDQAQRFIGAIPGASELLQGQPVGIEQVFARGISVEQACRLANLILDFVAKRNPDVALAVEVQMRGQHPLFSHPQLGIGLFVPTEPPIEAS